MGRFVAVMVQSSMRMVDVCPSFSITYLGGRGGMRAGYDAEAGAWEWAMLSDFEWRRLNSKTTRLSRRSDVDESVVRHEAHPRDVNHRRVDERVVESSSAADATATTFVLARSLVV